MKTTTLVPAARKRAQAAIAEQALMERLPVDTSALRKIMRYAEPKKLKLAFIAVAGGAALLSLIGKLGHDRIYRTTVSKELRRQLEPLNQKLDRLEAQNEELKAQNEELKAKLENA